MSENKKVIPATLIGSAIGDALGMPFEETKPRMHTLLKEWDGKSFLDGTHHVLPAGHFTDDTEMAYALAEAILYHGDVYSFSKTTVAEEYMNLYNKGITGVGGTTSIALRGMHMKWFEKSKHYRNIFDRDFPSFVHVYGRSYVDSESVGAGTAMRAAPIGVFYHRVPEMIRRACKADAYITHKNNEAYAASLAIAATVAGICRYDRMSLSYIYNVKDFLSAQLMILEDDSIVGKSVRYALVGYDENSTVEDIVDERFGRFGNAWQITATSILCAFRALNLTRTTTASPLEIFMKGVSSAIKLGGDTDTRGAITGAILGAYAGIDVLSKTDLYRKLNHKYIPNFYLLSQDTRLYEKSIAQENQDADNKNS